MTKLLELWNSFLFYPLVNALIVFYQLLFNNFGLAIIFLTILIRFLMVPITSPSMEAAKKMQVLAPELARLKKKYGKDTQGFAKAQMELYRQKGINPAAGCLPQIIQLVVLIALYQAFIEVLKPNGTEVVAKLNQILYPPFRLAEQAVINTKFLWLDLAKPDVFNLPGLAFPLPGIFLILSALIQMISSKMMAPAVSQAQEVAEKTPEKTDDFAAAMQTQMTYVFPLMTILIGYTFPSGLVVYWLIFSLFTVFQQYLIGGLGGLEPWLRKIKLKTP